MGLEQQLNDTLKQAMKEKDQATADTVRMIKTKIMERRTAKGFTGTVDDALITDVIGGNANPVSALSGPNIAAELARYLPGTAVAASPRSSPTSSCRIWTGSNCCARSAAHEMKRTWR